MNRLDTLKVAERLIMNLEWLQTTNPLLTNEQLLKYGKRYSSGIRDQYEQIKDLWTNELSSFKTLPQIMRYILDSQLSTICANYTPPIIKLDEDEDIGLISTMQKLAGSCETDLSLTTSRGRSENLGGGSKRKKKTA